MTKTFNACLSKLYITNSNTSIILYKIISFIYWKTNQILLFNINATINHIHLIKCIQSYPIIENV